ncbi:MAG: NEW3 domain-containing protein, partial [Planctomycetia bacterium]|nr:NEW3 domain-containing protein [Planctomycetia bacterium]
NTTQNTVNTTQNAAHHSSGMNNGVIQGQGKPGNTELEGIQVSRLTVEKAAPAEIQVGRASTWTITVRNEGKTDVNGVQIHDSVPQGTQLVNTHPAAKVSENGEITWNVGNMPSGTMAVVKMELIPTREGEVGSIASVTCRSEASAKTVATRPLLKVETFGDAQILLGNQTELSIVVSNPGTGVTRNVILSETVPPELQFEGGAELRYEVGDLQPGESKTTKLPLTAVRAGKFTNRIIARSEPGLVEESVLAMEVTAPAIELKLVGPSKRFLDKEGTYRLQLTNTGTATAQNVKMKAVLPSGWKFVSANNFGTFVPESRATLWQLEELGAGDTAEAEVVVSPTEIGTYTLSYEASADICQTVSGTKSVSVEGIAALMFQVVDSNDPIQVGEDTRYTVEVVNQGSKQAENVQIAVEIPSGLQVVASEEDVRVMNTTEGKEIVFAPVPTLGPKATKVYRFTLRGVTSGDQRVAVKLSSKEFPTPIVKEESTRVFTE